ncbi:MAG: hypothetical protein ACI4S9_04165, partial [Christensenellales bacterium]
YNGIRKVESSNYLDFLTVMSFVLTVVFGVISLRDNGFVMDLTTVLIGLLAAVSTVLAIYLFVNAYNCGGAYSMVVLIVNIGFWLPILLSGIFLGEEVSAFQLSGILLMVFIVILVNFRKNKASQETVSATAGANTGDGKSGGKVNLWLIIAFSASVFNALISFSGKLIAFYYPDGNHSGFYFLTYLFAFVISLSLWGITSLYKRRPMKISKPTFLYALAAAVCFGVSFFIIALLPKYVDGSTQFTVTLSLSIIASIIIGVVFYKEKITARSVVSFLCCICAIVLQVI